ncbi:hypothetical protein [Thermocatellispora tengchongensis]|uniref:hypothetical protein n=1 Tax=Thermocatellispora tengchongensis TaxID=1073253 RepID=UPI003371AE93
MALSADVPLLFTGSIVSSVGLGVFSAVDRVLALDVLSEREADAGRYLGVFGFATSVPQSAAPLLAPLRLAAGAGARGEELQAALPRGRRLHAGRRPDRPSPRRTRSGISFACGTAV